MLYEIRVMHEDMNGFVSEDRYLTEQFTMSTADGLNAIKFKQKGKSRNTFVRIPNEYQMKKYTKRFSLIICEVETGRKVYKINK